MEQAEIDRVRRALRQRPKPPWRVLWQYRPAQQVGTGSMERWSRRRTQLQAGWKLLWTERLRRDLAPIYQLATCRRGRHRDAYLVADDLVGGLLGDDYPEVAICELFPNKSASEMLTRAGISSSLLVPATGEQG